MEEAANDKILQVTFGGQTIVDTNALLRDPKVKRTLEKLSEANKPLRRRRGMTFLRPSKTSA